MRQRRDVITAAALMAIIVLTGCAKKVPPPIETRRESRYERATRFSAVYPIPPQYCRQESATSRDSRGSTSRAICACAWSAVTWAATSRS